MITYCKEFYPSASPIHSTLLVTFLVTYLKSRTQSNPLCLEGEVVFNRLLAVLFSGTPVLIYNRTAVTGVLVF